MKIFFSISFLFYLSQVSFSQCPTLDYDGSTYFENPNNFSLHSAPEKYQHIVNWVSNRFFSKDYFPKLLGYKIQGWEYPKALATTYKSTPKYDESESIAGETKSGYLWMDKIWMDNNIPIAYQKPKPEAVFLIAHEIMHIHQRKSTDVMRIVKKDKFGKPIIDSITRKPIFKKDTFDDYLSGFNHIPENRVDKINELFADYGAGIALYDLLLYAHDEWIVSSSDSLIVKAHQMKYNSIVKSITSFIENDLKGSESTHGTSKERVDYFLKGILDRRNFIFSRIKIPRNRRIEVEGKKGGIFLLLFVEGKKIIELYSK